jgi:hypothetical protein
MAELTSNVNAVFGANSGQTGYQSKYKEPGVPIAIVLVPKSFTGIPAADIVSQAAFSTYVNAFFNGTGAATRQTQWFLLAAGGLGMDDFKDDTKKPATEDTGRFALTIFEYPTKWTWRNMINMGMFIETRAFNQQQNYYNAYVIDSNFVWNGQIDPSGSGMLCPYTFAELQIDNVTRRNAKSNNNQYMVSASFSNYQQLNSKFAYFDAGIDPTSINGLQNAVLLDVSSIIGASIGGSYTYAATTDIIVTCKAGEGSDDIIQDYGALGTNTLTAACFTAYNLSTGATATIASIPTGGNGMIQVAGQTYYFIALRLSAAPTATNLVQVSLAAPAALNAIVALSNLITAVIQAGVNGANCAVKTF